jgi:deoxyribonuclease V
VIVYSFPEMVEIERTWAVRPCAFPTSPGLLTLPEVPALLAAFAKLRTDPDLIFCGGHGFAHPRRFGIASHLGVLPDCPNIGCASRFWLGKAGAKPILGIHGPSRQPRNGCAVYPSSYRWLQDTEAHQGRRIAT